MTDSAGTVPPFPGFPGFPPAEMLDRMWGMMRLTPFGSAFPGSEPGAAQGLGPSLSMMSDMMTPLTNIEELDKRITDLRAVEQWLKLNLSMLQSAIQALEVQRATLSTLRAFGAFAQSMSPSSTQSAPEPEPRDARAQAGAASAEAADAAAGAPAGFDASAWWNLLQSQFNQLAQFAMVQPAAAAEAATEAAQAAAEAAAPRAKPAAKRSGGSGGANGGGAGSKPGARSAKRSSAQPE
ncbi:PhaM family polyhydroxyalkanoate granule multifunctional regulatory protein [Paraburkholderia oxyphila]|uniref:PhaM family polyhydroxyalkanoate granule multifunctional regulatory protein n=1 Tax=Paraburkholderia oxyphila TaxID=614212 RepID=UPI00047F715F|nr:PhaM family polyhydroxyalkanoate granule multifunctional regulatory protein [Paraburkholderia oxyphila]